MYSLGDFVPGLDLQSTSNAVIFFSALSFKFFNLLNGIEFCAMHTEQTAPVADMDAFVNDVFVASPNYAVFTISPVRIEFDPSLKSEIFECYKNEMQKFITDRNNTTKAMFFAGVDKTKPLTQVFDDVSLNETFFDTHVIVLLE